MFKIVLALMMLTLPVSEDLFFGLLGEWGVSAVDQQKDIHETVKSNRFVANSPEDLCVKLRRADFNHDGKVNNEDYNLLYQQVLQIGQTGLRSAKDHETRLRMDLVSRGEADLNINEEDLGILYNFVANQLSYCPNH